MAKFLATNGVGYLTEGILMSAQKSLTLVMSSLKLTNLFLEHMKEADGRGVEIKIVFGQNELTASQQQVFVGLPNVTLYQLDTVQARCCFNESLILLSSMNSTDFEDKESKHMGMLIERQNDEVLYKEVIQETYAMLSAATKVSEIAMTASLVS